MEIIPDAGTEVGESAQATGLAFEALEFEHSCDCLTKSGESGKECKGPAAQKDKRG